MNPKIITVLRWITVLPAAWAAYGGVGLVTISFGFMDKIEFNKPLDSSAIQMVTAMIAPSAFIMAGAATAPRHKLTTAFSLAALHAVFLVTVCVCFYHNIIPDKLKLFTLVWWDVVLVFVSMASCFLGCLEAAAGSPVLRLFRKKSRDAKTQSAHSPK
jgi:hypothetical protein